VEIDTALGRDIWLVSPMIVLAIGSLLLLMLEVFIKERWPRAELTAILLFVSLFAITLVAPDIGSGGTIFYGTIYADPFSIYFSGLMIFGSLLVVFLGNGRLAREGIGSPGEYYSLLLMSLVGAMIFVSSAELITLFLGLEIMSMALYALCAFAINLRRSAEAGLKYFFLGSFASAFLLFGIALIYGLTGTTTISEIAPQLQVIEDPILYLAIGFFLVGLIFKIGGVPFHFWAPDVYQGAPTTISAFMATVVKVAAVGALLRIMWSIFGGEIYSVWVGAVWFIAALTMIVGNILALRQRSLKRMLAYSSIAHAGYIIAALLAPGQFGGGEAILFYLVVYTLMTVGAFGVVLLSAPVALDSPQAIEADDITRLNGFARTQPVLAAIMALFMFALAGLPPGIAGFVGKFYIFHAVVQAEFVGLAIIGVLGSAVSCYYYLRVVVAMYFLPENSESGLDLPPVHTLAIGALVVCAVGVIILGIIPAPVYSAAQFVIQSF